MASSGYHVRTDRHRKKGAPEKGHAMVSRILSNLGAVNANAFYAVLYFIVHNVFFFAVVAAVIYLIRLDIGYGREDYVSDGRNII